MVDQLQVAPPVAVLGNDVGVTCGPRASIRIAAELAANAPDRELWLEKVRQQTLLDSVKFSHPRCVYVMRLSVIGACGVLCLLAGLSLEFVRGLHTQTRSLTRVGVICRLQLTVW